jgi:hypothetical protein
VEVTEVCNRVNGNLNLEIQSSGYEIRERNVIEILLISCILVGLLLIRTIAMINHLFVDLRHCSTQHNKNLLYCKSTVPKNVIKGQLDWTHIAQELPCKTHY